MSHRYISILIAILFFAHISLLAQEQDVIIISGESSVEFPDHKSLNEIKKIAKDQAIINALEMAFGVILIEGNSTYSKNIVTGEKTETSSIFNSIGNHWVKGEVLEILDTQFKEVQKTVIINGTEEQQIKQIACNVKIRAREIEENVIYFSLFTLNCLNVNCKTSTFQANDDFYLFFHSPLSGYLAVFLDDGIQAQRLFPYRGMGEQFERGVSVKANVEYFLFSDEKKFDYFETFVDEYVFETTQPMEQNRLFVIFSISPIVQPYLNSSISNNELSDEEIGTGWAVPIALPSEEFQKWLIDSRIKNRDITVKIEDITIKK